MSDYIPFGKEWETELLKRVPKKQIIAMFRDSCIQRMKGKQIAASNPGMSIPAELFERLEYFRELLVSHGSNLLGRLHDGKKPPEVLRMALEVEIGRCQETRSILEAFIGGL